MKRRAILVFVGLAAMVWLPRTSQAAEPSQAVFIQCLISTGAVEAFSSSTGAPVITVGASCAQTIATILDAKLKLKSSDMSDPFRPKFLYTTGK